MEYALSFPTLILSYPQIHQLTDEILIHIPCAGIAAWQLLREEFNIYGEWRFQKDEWEFVPQIAFSIKYWAS